MLPFDTISLGSAGTFLVQRQQPREDRILFHHRRVGIISAVGSPDGAIERGVGVV